MNENEIKEMINNLGYGETPPEALMRLVFLFRKRKSAVFPEPITPSDVVTVTMLYDMAMSMKEKK